MRIEPALRSAARAERGPERRLTRSATMLRRRLVPLALLAPLLAACEDARAPDLDTDAVREGRAAIRLYGCGSCHAIPGIGRADGRVGPPLTHVARQSYIAGRLPNTLPNLAAWIADPDALDPGTAMPDLGVPPRTAAAIAAYLYAQGEGA